MNWTEILQFLKTLRLSCTAGVPFPEKIFFCALEIKCWKKHFVRLKTQNACYLVQIVERHSRTRKGKKSLGASSTNQNSFKLKAVYQNGLLQLREWTPTTHSHPFKVNRIWFSKKLCWRTSFCVHPRTWGCATDACAVFGVEHACKEKNLQLLGLVRIVFLCNAMMRNIIWRGVTSFLFLTNDKWAWFKNVGPPQKKLRGGLRN